MKLYSKMCYSGLLLFPITLYILYRCMDITGLIFDKGLLVLFSIIPTLYTYSINVSTKANGKTKYGLLDAFNYKNDPYAVKSLKNKAKYPQINSNLVSKEATGIVLGKNHNRYVVNDLNKGGAHHSIVIGTTGCGKTSSIILPTVLANKDIAKFVIDIKGEISEKGERINDKDILVINPTNMKSYGYNPLYKLSKDSDEQEIIDTVSNIMYSIMPINANEKNPFWINGARDLFMGMCIYYIRNNTTNFIDIIDEILGKPIKDSIEEIVNEADQDSVEYRYLIKFFQMADETLSGIFAQLSNSLTIFANDFNIRHMMRDNVVKISPKALNEGKSIYLVIKEEKLSQYASVLHLIINQMISEMELRSEDSKPVLMIIDELARITAVGKIHKLLDGLATLRSRNVSILLATQSIESLENAFNKPEVSALMTNIPYKIILQASSIETQKEIIAWAGKYKEFKQSYGKSGKNDTDNMTYEDKDIVDGSDLVLLPTTEEAILISPYGYNRFKKCPYYKDKKMKINADEIKKHNKAIKEIQNSFET